jgi:hypothetical protein
MKGLNSYRYINDRILAVRFNITRGHLSVIGIHTPEEGQLEETGIF